MTTCDWPTLPRQRSSKRVPRTSRQPSWSPVPATAPTFEARLALCRTSSHPRSSLKLRIIQSAPRPKRGSDHRAERGRTKPPSAADPPDLAIGYFILRSGRRKGEVVAVRVAQAMPGAGAIVTSQEPAAPPWRCSRRRPRRPGGRGRADGVVPPVAGRRGLPYGASRACTASVGTIVRVARRNSC